LIVHAHGIGIAGLQASGSSVGVYCCVVINH
jgi:hypothetical protein